ncbi:MAG: succinate dehydrogenase, hydrophobic membrane anchor protein [Paracoccaceae bacterium]|nr:succinate dehydrogenase, hydrophobic membrane anchor protein [Paracoccaceae bacterium]
MAFLTDRKRATGMGSAREGTNRHWSMTVNSYGLLVLIPLFIFTFGSVLGKSHEEVTAYFNHPVPALITALTIWFGMMHFRAGVRVLIEDYVHGFNREIWIIVMNCVSYALAVTGVFAVLKMAL